MKKKPHVKEVFDNIQNYTEEDIDELPSNLFPKWIKDVLKERTKRNGNSAEEEAARIAQLMIDASNKE